MKFLCVLFFIAIVHAQTGKEESKEKRDLFLPPIRQTVVRPAMINRVVQPIIKDVVQPVITQKSFQTFVNPVSVQNFGMQNTMFTNRFVKRSADKEESKEKRDLFLTPIRQTVVRPALLNRVVQPVIQDVVQPVVHQKEFQTIVNPVRVQNVVGGTFGMQNTMFTNRFVKRSADKEESKEKRDLFLTPIRQTVVRPALLNRVVQPVIQDVVQPVVHQKEFQTIVNPVRVQNFGMQNTMFTNRFVKRSADKEESKEKRDLFLTPIRQTVVRPALLNRVVQPVIQDVVQPVVHQKEFQTIVNPVRVQNVVGGTLGMGSTFVGNGMRFI